MGPEWKRLRSSVLASDAEEEGEERRVEVAKRRRERWAMIEVF